MPLWGAVLGLVYQVKSPRRATSRLHSVVGELIDGKKIDQAAITCACYTDGIE